MISKVAHDLGVGSLILGCVYQYLCSDMLSPMPFFFQCSSPISTINLSPLPKIQYQITRYNRRVQPIAALNSSHETQISFILNSFRCLAVTAYRTSPVLFHTKGHQESFYPSMNPSQQLQRLKNKKALSHTVCSL